MNRAVACGVCGACWLLASAAFAAKSATNRPPAETDWPSRLSTNAEEQVALEQKLNEAWAALPLKNKLMLMRSQTALRAMPKEERQFIEERINRFLAMNPAEREQLKRNQQRWNKMSPAEREQARAAYEKHRKEFAERTRKLPPPVLEPLAGAVTATNQPTNPTTGGAP